MSAAKELGSIKTTFDVRTTAGEAESWRDTLNGPSVTQPNRWQDLPRDDAAELCLAFGSLDKFAPPLPPESGDPLFTFAVIGVADGSAAMEFAGQKSSELPDFPLPGISREQLPATALVSAAGTPASPTAGP